MIFFVFFFKQKTAYEMRISDWSSDVCSSDLPKEISKLEKFYASATPVVPGGSDQSGLVKDVAVLNENFFTAIYCVVFQRSHALLAYSQFTEGEPFSSLQTCVPTTQHVLNHKIGRASCRERVCQYV